MACCFVPVSRESGEQLILFVAARMAFLQRNCEEEFLKLKGIPFRAFHRASWSQHGPFQIQRFLVCSEICGLHLRPWKPEPCAQAFLHAPVRTLGSQHWQLFGWQI
jgi:hypothetical protein